MYIILVYATGEPPEMAQFDGFAIYIFVFISGLFVSISVTRQHFKQYPEFEILIMGYYPISHD